jgi:hypothetical protein
VLVEIKMAKEAWRGVGSIFVLKTRHVIRGGVRGEKGNIFATLSSVDACCALGKLVLGLRVEGDAFEVFAARVACEALRVKASASGRYNPASNGKSALRA